MKSTQASNTRNNNNKKIKTKGKCPGAQANKKPQNKKEIKERTKSTTRRKKVVECKHRKKRRRKKHLKRILITQNTKPKTQVNQ